MISKTERKLTYSIALLLSNENRKTFEELGRQVNWSGDTISRIVEHNAATAEELLQIARNLFGKKRLKLIIDDTLILKLYSKIIPGTSDNYDSSNGKCYRSLCSVVAMLTDGHIAIPIDQAFWTELAFKPDGYQKKWEIAKQLITQIIKKIDVHMVLADGLYAVVDFIKWLVLKDIRFEMRFHANRVVSDGECHGQIKYHRKLKLSGKRPMRTIKAQWYGLQLYFTSYRRVTKYGKVITTYQVSNLKCSTRKHVRAYECRWNIEKFFRTVKQKLGLNDCQSRKQPLQEKHILNVFFTYALLQYERKKKRLKNVESAIKSMKSLSFAKIKHSFMRSAEIFGVA